MTEYQPLVSGGRLKGVIGLGGDAVLICDVDGGGCRLYFWVTADEAVNVTGLVRGRGVKLGGGFAPTLSWLKSPPYVHARVFESVGRCVRWVYDVLRRSGGLRRLEGAEVLVGVSGGKDSAVALATVEGLRRVAGSSFSVRPMYVYVPYLDSVSARSFIEGGALGKALGVEVEVVEGRGRDVKRYLKWRGMPRRGSRWCTYFKVRPMRDVMRSDRRVVEVVADRVTESLKRAWRLVRFASESLVLAGRRFRPTYLMTLPDVVAAVRSAGLTHPHYLLGYPRVACALCPFRSISELGDGCSEALRDVEDPGLIEEVWRRDWVRRYGPRGISFEGYVTHALWRFSPGLAKEVFRLKEALLKDADFAGGRLARGEVRNALKNIWTSREAVKAPKAPNPWLIAEVVRAGLEGGWVAATIKGGRPHPLAKLSIP